MSRTKRIYNSRHWKWHAEWSLRMRYTTPNNAFLTRENGWIYAGFVYHPYKEACMGHCRGCRSEKEKGWRHKRYRLKYELRLELRRLNIELDIYLKNDRRNA